MNSKILLGAGIFAVAIIAVIAISVIEDESSLTEQEISKSIQNEISKSPKITGVHAQNICKILDVGCPSNKTFQAVLDTNDGYTKFTYSQIGVANTFSGDYHFRIIDNELDYKTPRNPTEWITFVDADFDGSWMWDDDALARGETINDDDLSVKEYSRTFQFEGDELGNYEQWCQNSFGIFSKDNPDHHGNVTCEFTDPSVYEKARDALHKLEKTTITGELAQHLCDAYGKKCLPGVVIGVEYDLRTGHLIKEKKIDGIYMEFRIIGDVIEFRPLTYSPSAWVTFTG